MAESPDSAKPVAPHDHSVAERPQFEPFSPLVRIYRVLTRWWRMFVRAEVDQSAVIARIKEDSSFSPRYAFLTCMSAGIAILGLLLSSPAVVIGAMLLSPLLYPIMGAGFALATGDSQWLKKSGKALILGSILAILFAALVVLVSPLQTVTPEIASRTRPNLFDLGVALFSGLAGAYAMIRGGMGTIVGVAIATALMPPLAVIGFGLATFNWAVFGGSLGLFFTNFMTIALSTTVVAWLYGFRTYLSERQSQFQIFAMITVFIGLAIPLAFALQQIAWEANVSRSANGYIKDQFGNRARVSQIDIDFNADPIVVSASVFTPRIIPGAEEQSARVLTRTFKQPINVSIEQYRVEMGSDAADAQLAALRAQEQQQAVESQVARLRETLALIAGVTAEEVIIDAPKRRAVVIAKSLPGASLQTYKILEQRMAGQMEDWAVNIQPPPLDLPSITVSDGMVAADATGRLDLISWAAMRSPLILRMSGTENDMDLVGGLLARENVLTVKGDPVAESSGEVSFNWMLPGDGGPDAE